VERKSLKVVKRTAHEGKEGLKIRNDDNTSRKKS
jgi:hypothetical protein